VNGNGHEEIDALAGAYVLGALTAEERAAFERRLQESPALAAEVRDLAVVANALPWTPPLLEPPPSLRARVVRAATGRDEPTASERVVTMPTERVVTMPVEREAVVVRRTSWAPWLAAAASLVAALALGAAWWQSQSQMRQLRADLDETRARLSATEQQMAVARGELAETQAQAAILSAPDLSRVDLKGQEVSPTSAARVFWSRQNGVVLTASNLPRAPAGKTYQLWVLTATKPVSAGIFNTDPAGRATVTLPTPADVPPAAGMAVSLEPAGGVPQPTGAIYLAGMTPAVE
jgi:anti-sigma-K factor RskA